MSFIAAAATLYAAGEPLPAKAIALGVLWFIFAAAFIVLGVVALQNLAVVKEFSFNAFSNQRVLISLTGLPTEETEQMMEELGALVADIKTDKEKAYEVWKE